MAMDSPFHTMLSKVMVNNRLYSMFHQLMRTLSYWLGALQSQRGLTRLSFFNAHLMKYFKWEEYILVGLKLSHLKPWQLVYLPQRSSLLLTKMHTGSSLMPPHQHPNVMRFSLDLDQLQTVSLHKSME